MKTKLCCRCEKKRLTKFFYTNAKHKDGLFSYCISCAKEASAESNAKRRATGQTYEPQNKGVKTCKKCNTEKAVTEFSVNRLSKDGRSSWCSKCHNTYKKNNSKKYKYPGYNKTHPEAWTEYQNEYMRKYTCDPINAARIALSQKLVRIKRKNEVPVTPAKCCAQCTDENKKLKATFKNNFVIRTITNKFSEAEIIRNIKWLCSKCICQNRKKPDE